ncbi:putative NADPH-quinone reductase [Paenibacillus phyllosphaerae]|uniref:Putative NADPH-quinone reductase n=1 Tax=Paenibacillus phyllosphaerae TaxID=274593 RepID=A0A7W5AVT3_9BACL|nr:NAD(P)H-dependent oxidoreductase [Paenibacillus phyllosphaerae]MBB3109582.1 putative NADPH-quinone reductase [Paenibacillus phyllosphaerae]
MKTLVIVTHPNINESRINKAWVQELQQHSNITIHQLYQAYPNEVIDVAREQALLEAHDRIILQYPFYWYNMPPLLKKWLDAVMQYGWAFGPDGDKMQGKEIGIAISTYGSEESYQLGGANRFTIEELLKPIDAICHYIGARFIPPFTLSDVSNVTDEELEKSKIDYVRYITSVQTTSV